MQYTLVLTATVDSVYFEGSQGIALFRDVNFRIFEDNSSRADPLNPSTYSDGTLILTAVSEQLAAYQDPDEPSRNFFYGHFFFTGGVGFAALPACAREGSMSAGANFFSDTVVPPEGLPSGYTATQFIHGLCDTYTLPCKVSVLAPLAAPQIIHRRAEDGGFGPYSETVIELRQQPLLPLGLSLRFQTAAVCFCGGSAPVDGRLLPRSGTGRIFPLMASTASPGDIALSTYFVTDNMTSPGYYDLELHCPDGGTELVDPHLRYVGYLGYQSAGTLYNATTGNVMRGARVSIWRLLATGGFEWYGGMLASDGTYSFDVPSGTYRVLVQYGLGGEQWRGPFNVQSPIPYEDMDLDPMTSDIEAPVVSWTRRVGTTIIDGMVVDNGTGLSVVEANADGVNGTAVDVEPFVLGAQEVWFAVALGDTSGNVSLRCEDQLGNRREVVLELSTLDVSRQGPGAGAVSVRAAPNPFRGQIEFALFVRDAIAGAFVVYDASGREVASLAKGSFRAGLWSVRWDGTDRRGRRAPAGVYVAVFSQGRERISACRAVLMR